MKKKNEKSQQENRETQGNESQQYELQELRAGGGERMRYL